MLRETLNTKRLLDEKIDQAGRMISSYPILKLDEDIRDQEGIGSKWRSSSEEKPSDSSSSDKRSSDDGSFAQWQKETREEKQSNYNPGGGKQYQRRSTLVEKEEEEQSNSDFGWNKQYLSRSSLMNRYGDSGGGGRSSGGSSSSSKGSWRRPEKEKDVAMIGGITAVMRVSEM